MKQSNKSYADYAKQTSKQSPIVKNCVLAFLFGGGICTIAELLLKLFLFLKIENETAKNLVPVTLIIITAILTGCGVYDKMAKFGGAGCSVPITGFANAVVSPAIDCKTEGFIFGVGAKIFTIAGPVILFSGSASVIYGIIYYLKGVIMG